MEGQTFYPGVGADEAIGRIYEIVGRVTTNWADVEYGMFELFYTALSNRWEQSDIKTFQSLFFYEFLRTENEDAEQRYASKI